MLELTPETDNFKVRLPTELLPPNIRQIFNEKIVNKVLGSHDDFLGYLTESIKNVSIPDAGMAAIKQTYKNHVKKTPQLASREDSVNDTTIVITFRSLTALVNFWCLRYVYFLRTFNKDYNDHVGDIIFTFYDDAYDINYNMVFKDCTYAGISGLTFAYDVADISHTEFSCTFEYTDMAIDFKI